MEGRVNINNRHIISQSMDWYKLVNTPQKEGRYVEAFGSADALIDSSIENLLRQIYEPFKCQDLINELTYLRGSIDFFAIHILRILESKTVVDNTFVQKVRQFKKARNLVLHDTKAEIALIYLNPDFLRPEKTEDFEDLAKQEADKWLNEAHEIYLQLDKYIRKVNEKGADYYFSQKFYLSNPRIKMIKQKFPKLKTKKKK